MNTSSDIGTAAEALTELSWSNASVFKPYAFPPSASGIPWSSDVIDIANRIVLSKPPTSFALASSNNSVGDPASLGIAVLIANWTRPDETYDNFSLAASQQLDYLINLAPRSDTGAISSVTDGVQLWAEFVQSGPPFIAYYGALQGGDAEAGLLQLAYDQCRLYRDELRDDNGLWRHVTLGDWQDDTHWSTGNGRAAAGMLRVLETIKNSDQASDFVDQQLDLVTWIREIVAASWTFQQPDGTLLNELDNPTSFAESSGTALLASVTYRLAFIRNATNNLNDARMALRAIANNIDNDGWLQNTVDQHTWHSPTAAGSHSPDGQSFVLLLHSAWRDYMESFTGEDDDEDVD